MYCEVFSVRGVLCVFCNVKCLSCCAYGFVFSVNCLVCRVVCKCVACSGKMVV